MIMMKLAELRVIPITLGNVIAVAGSYGQSKV
jgi:hypothetical protein